MDVIVIVLLVILTIFLVVVEVLLLPGITFAAVGAFAAGLYAVYLTYLDTGLPMAMLVFFIALILSAVTVFVCLKQRNISKISLKVNSDSIVLPNVRSLIRVGDVGVAVSRLAPMGTVQIGEHSVEAKSKSGLIDPRMRIKVIGYEDNSVLVEKI